jgi:hypothetical protein
VTLQEYLDAARFPLTTQKGLQPRQQLMLDAFNYDQGKEHSDQLNAEEQAVQKELEAKMADNARLARELAEAEKAGGRRPE